MVSQRDRVVRILGLGGLPEDGVLRKSIGEAFSVYLGDENDHEGLREFCTQLQTRLDVLGLELSDLSPDQLVDLLDGLGAMEDTECAS